MDEVDNIIIRKKKNISPESTQFKTKSDFTLQQNGNKNSEHFCKRYYSQNTGCPENRCNGRKIKIGNLKKKVLKNCF